MPSELHELIVQLFRNRPPLAADLVADALGTPPPAHESIRFEQNTLSQIEPAEYRADLVVVLERDRPVLGIVVEVQLSPDPDKRYSWPVYAAALRARLRAPVCILVVAPDADVAAWAAVPIDIGAGSIARPLVAGPQLIPVVTDPDAARAAPELAVLSVLAHGPESNGLDIALAVMAAAVDLDTDRATLYTDLALDAVNAAARAALEQLMEHGNWEWKSPFAKKYVAQGIEKGLEQGRQQGIEQGERHLLVRLLERRFGGPLAPEARERIDTASTVDVERWAERLFSAESLEDVFAD